MRENNWNDDQDPLAAPAADIPIPSGFRLYNVEPTPADWRNRYGDAQRRMLSLSATSSDISGLSEVPIKSLWRLDVRDQKITDADFDLIARFDHLEELDASTTKITDAATLAIHTLQRLRVLRLGRCAITDAAIEHIAALRALEELDLYKTAVTDEGLRPLAFHPELASLNVRGTQVRGDGLAPLVTIPQLRRLSVDRKQHKLMERFAAERPDVEILY